MKRSTRRQQQRRGHREAKQRAQLMPGGESNYARKRKYLIRHGLWGWEVPEPKPWKGATE